MALSRRRKIVGWLTSRRAAAPVIAILIALGVGIGSATGVVWLADGGIEAHGATGATRHAWCPLNVSSGVETPRPGPTGNSSPNGSSYYANGTVVFYGSASGCTAPYTFTYVFGDGTSSSGPADVVHVYPGAGYYAGSLNVSDPSGSFQTSYFCINASSWPTLSVGSGNPAPPCSFVPPPSGKSSLLTPPSTWCTETPDGGGYDFSCSMSGALLIPLNVTQPSALSGTIDLSGPAQVWVLPSVWSCELEVQLTGSVHSCPPPYEPPPWPTWHTNISSAGVVDLATLPINVTNPVGVLPPANWAVVFVDAQSTDEFATITSSVTLVTP